jgi:hypothetical protein
LGEEWSAGLGEASAEAVMVFRMGYEADASPLRGRGQRHWAKHPPK